MRKALTLLTSLLLATATLVAAEPAAAVTNYTVTVVASGGSNEGTNWSYSNGVITPTASVSINASAIVSKLGLGALVLNGDKILVNASVVHSTANVFTVKATGNIIVDGGVTFQSQGGDIVFNSDSDANNTGHVRFGSETNCNAGNVTTNGGNIIVGGGANPGTGTTAAQNNDVVASCASGSPRAGVGIYNFSMNAGGGDIRIRGGSANLGTGVSTRAININGYSGVTPTFQTAGAGSIYIFGDGSAITQDNAWGIACGSITVTTGQGSITLESRGNPSGPTNARGMSIGGASTFTSSTGNVSFIDRTNGAISGYTGINLGAAITVTTNGDFAVQADEISQGGALRLDVANASIGSNTTSSFTNVYSTGTIDATGTSSLRIGSPGNAEAITLGAITTDGPLTVIGSTVTINAALSATASPITFVTSTGVTKGANGSITASALNLGGTATYSNLSSLTLVGGGAPITAPDISLSSSSQNVQIKSALAAYTIANSGGVVSSYSISPAAANGLSFNTSTGVLSGTPIALAGAVTYTITATNGAGSDTATFTIAVLAEKLPPPTPTVSYVFESRPIISANGQSFTLKTENITDIASVKINGKDVVFSKKESGDLVIELPAMSEGLPDLEVRHSGGIIRLQEFIKVVKPYAEKRTVQVSGLTGGAPAKSAVAALQASYLKGVPANIVSCVATVASDASDKDVRLAKKSAKAACQSMVEFSTYINTVEVKVNTDGLAGSKPALAVTFDKSPSGK